MHNSNGHTPFRGIPSNPKDTRAIPPPPPLPPKSSSNANIRPASGPSSSSSLAHYPAMSHRVANSLGYTMPVPEPYPPSQSGPNSTSASSTPSPSASASVASLHGAAQPATSFRRNPSLRPPGASPARIPGSHDILEPDADAPAPYPHSTREPPSPPPPPPFSPPATSSSSFSASPYFPNDIKQSQLYTPSISSVSSVPPASSLSVPHSDLRPIPSSEDILAVGQNGLVRRLSDASPESDVGHLVNRNGSTGSGRSAPLTRNYTTSTVASQSSALSVGAAVLSTPETSEFSGDYKARFSSGSGNRNPESSGSGYFSFASSSQPLTHHASSTPPSRLAEQIVRTMKGHDLYRESVYSEEYDDDGFEDLPDEFEDDLDAFVNFALLSNIAVWLRDQVPRGTHVKGSIPYPRAFTGKDIVNTLQSQIRRELLANQGASTNDRYIALQVARSLQQQLFFYEVEWGGRQLQDGVEDVYMFLDDQEGGAYDAAPEREELPTSVITVLTRCYAPSCADGSPCYSFACPRKTRLELLPEASIVAEPSEQLEKDWSETVDPDILRSLPESEINRQTIIHKLISKEAQYVRDLDIIDTVFITPMRYANPPLFPSNSRLESFLEAVFSNLSAVREANRRLLDMMNVRQREHSLVIKRIGDVLLEAATEFRLVYPSYIAQLPNAEKRLKDELEKNHELRLLLDQCQRNPEARRIDLKTFLNRPAEHVNKYEITLEAIAKETAVGNPDADYLKEAVQAFRSLQVGCQLQSWQYAFCKGPLGKLEWHNLLSEEARAAIPKKEQKRQSVIFELIKGEMQYVKDLENIQKMYIDPLREIDPPIIPRPRLEKFIEEVFNNFGQLYVHHQRLLERLHTIQRDEHPTVYSVTAAVFDAALNWREAYMEYITNYPKAEYRIVDEMNTNPAFKDFVEQCTRHPDANRLDMKSFVNRPIPRLARYELLLKGIMDASPEGHEDRENIPNVIEVIKALLKETQPGVGSAEQKVELWKYNANLVWKQGEYVDLDLLDDNRSLIHTGKLLRQPDNGFEWSGWSELFVLLFDNYLVLTKPKEKDGVTKYHVTRHPIPLELLTITNFADPPTQRGAGLLRFGNRAGGGGGGGGGGAVDSPGPSQLANQVTTPDTATDSRIVYPCTIHHTGRLGGLYVLYAESAQARAEWREKLTEAQGLRKVVQEANKVFEVETLSIDTFMVSSYANQVTKNPWSTESGITGAVTCSVPFTTADGRALVAIGCAEGVWIGFRHDARSMRRVLHLKMVTQCAMLEEFGIFLVLADKSLFAYHIEALVPSSVHLANTTQTPQKLSGTKDVHFFSVGKLGERTLVIYMKKTGISSIFRVLEPVVDKINEKTKQPVSFGSRLGFRAARSDWFRVYKDFFLPSESFDLIFLKARVAVLCTKGFEIMDLTDFKSVTIPQRDDPKHEKLAKRCDACRPMGMFRTSENEFLLCYNEFGLFVNRHGDPIKDKPLIEWEGTAERVAWHPPYILIFDSRFIEIRTVETGRLCQIIQGEDISAIWDGRGTSQPAPSFPREGQTWTDIFGLETRIHGVMRAPEPQSNVNGQLTARRPVSAQHVFELVPTIPLYVPERLGSPTPQHQTLTGHYHGPLSNSPPGSPRMSSASINWR